MKRRSFLKMSSLTAAGIAAGGVLPPTIRRALAIEPASARKTIQDVEHVVIFMQENRSFDHYFGSLRGVRGFGDPRPLVTPSGQNVWHQPSVGSASTPVLPFHLNSRRTDAQHVVDLNHDWRGPEVDWQYYNDWVRQKTPMTMGYYRRSDLPFYYALADAFTICDGYHASLFGPTGPNRLFLFSGTSGLSVGDNNKQVVDNVDDGNWTADSAKDRPSFNAFGWTTYAERLEQAGVSWKVYQEYDNFGDNSLQYFKKFRGLKKTNPLYRKARAWAAGSTAANAEASRGEYLVSAFGKDVREGKLPQVSWLVAPEIMSEHPRHAPGYGESLTARLLDALVSRPDVWSRTVFFLNYDENGGFFDHIAPSMPATSSMLGESAVDTQGEDYHGQAVGFGPRVPMLVISPWSRGGWVNSQVFDHTSVLRFLEQRFGVIEPNIDPWRRAVAGDLCSTLDFAGAEPLWPQLPDTSDAMALVDSAASLPAPHPPATPQMPRQEAGQRPARALPYDFDVYLSSCKDGSRQLVIDNGSPIGVALNVYDLTKTQGTRYYTADAKGQLTNALPHSPNRYDVVVHGPAGFVRRFTGKPWTGPEVYIENTGNQDTLALRITDWDGNGVTCHVYDAYSQQTRALTLTPNASIVATWSIKANAHWYDLAIRLTSSKHYLRWFAGHRETGKASFSDPAINTI